VIITVPEGAAHGSTMRMNGGGDAGIRGGKAGDLYVHIRVEEDERFTRRGVDIISTHEVPIFQALLGGVVDIKTFWGDVVLTIPENTKDGARFKIHEKGVKNKQGAGDHIVTIRYQYPKNISGKIRKALEGLI